jgi:hypothetical protein
VPALVYEMYIGAQGNERPDRVRVPEADSVAERADVKRIGLVEELRRRGHQEARTLLLSVLRCHVHRRGPFGVLSRSVDNHVSSPQHWGLARPTPPPLAHHGSRVGARGEQQLRERCGSLKGNDMQRSQ